MAHEIDTTTGKAAIFVTGEAAWHRLGKVVSNAKTSEEAIKLACLDWQVEQWNLRAMNMVEQGVFEECEVGTHVANVRSDTGSLLGIVGSNYRVFQNRQAFDFMDAIVQDKLAMFETAGAIRGGRRVWMLARLPKEIRVAGDDLVNPYILLTNSHDGSMALRMIPTTVRVVCNNTLNLALRRAASTEGLVISHHESLEQRVAEARTKLGVIVSRMDEFADQAQALARKSLNSEELANYFTSLVNGRSEKQQKKLLESFAVNFDNERNNLPGIGRTAWAAYNAVSEWADHQMGAGAGSNTDKRIEGRLNSIWFGQANAFKQMAFTQAMELAV